MMEGYSEELSRTDRSPLRPLAPTLSTIPSKQVIDIQIPIIKNYPKGRKFVKVREGESHSPPH